MSSPPSERVLRAFRVEATPRRLPGGQGSSWFVGGLVLKPGGGPVHDWWAAVLEPASGEAVDGGPTAGFRLAPPLRTADGAWSCQGWVASRWLEGSAPDLSQPSTWPAVLEAGRALHRAVAHLQRPACLSARDDRWALADRAAWGEGTLLFRPALDGLARRLRRAVRPLGSPQVVHADLTGNVLLSPRLPPAVIDVSPLWRPPEYAEGVIVADALCWHDAPASLLDQAGVGAGAVARALLFRLGTTELAARLVGSGVDVRDEARRYERAATSIGI